MKKILSGALILIFAFSISLPLYADSGNKIVAKYDLAGTYQNHSSSYAWGDVSGSAMWNCKVHIKVAEDSAKSKGMVKFSTDGVNVVGHVEDVKIDYSYWGEDNIAAVGWSNYNGQKYYFMFMFSDERVWFSLSETPYDAYWNANTVFLKAQRDYETHSLRPGTTLDFDPKIIR